MTGIELQNRIVHQKATPRNRGPLVSAGVILGAGLAGLLQGTVLHQILQVHHLVSGRHRVDSRVGAGINVFWDGVFQAGCWLLVVLGLVLLWNAARRSDVPLRSRILVGALLLGAGLFNSVEGVLDHHVFHLHSVVQRLGVSPWDLVFLAVGGVVPAAIGSRMLRAARRVEGVSARRRA